MVIKFAQRPPPPLQKKTLPVFCEKKYFQPRGVEMVFQENTYSRKALCISIDDRSHR